MPDSTATNAVSYTTPWDTIVMQHGSYADLGAKPLGIGSNRLQCLG